MALAHASSGDVLDIRPLGPALPDARTHTLVPGPPVEIFRLVLLSGKSMPAHQVPGALTIQCIEGAVELDLPDRSHLLRAGDLVYLEPKVPHGLTARDDASILVTLVRSHADAGG